MKIDDQIVDSLTDLLRDASAHGQICVAFSGGLDSHVLLHVLAENRQRLNRPLLAIHVNHRLQAESNFWESHCRAICEELAIPFTSTTVDDKPSPGESIEAWARQWRYRLLGQLAGTGGVVVTAHHARDQAETFLLRSLRGAGVEGLAGIAEAGTVCGVRVVRPMLRVAKMDIDGYAASRGLHVVEDPSNRDRRHDRNLIRHEVMPVLRERWPALDSVWSRDAELLRRDASLLRRLVGQELDRMSDEQSLDLNLLAREPGDLREAVLRLWLCRGGSRPPSHSELQHVLMQSFSAARDRNPVVRHGDREIRRFRSRLYRVPILSDPDTEFGQTWSPRQALALPWGTLRGSEATGVGIRVHLAEQAELEVRLRRGGERCRPRWNGRHQTLKHVLQQLGVPPWERAWLPLVYVNGELAAIADYLVFEEYAAQGAEPGWRIQWDRTMTA